MHVFHNFSLFLRYGYPWNALFFGGKFKFLKKLFFPPQFSKKIKDGYSGKIAEILEKLQSEVTYFDEMMKIICPHFSISTLDQPRPTQIGSSAKFLKNRNLEGQNLDYF